MAVACAGIRKALPCFRNEFPIVRHGLECELEDAESAGVANFTVWFWRGEVAMILASSADDKFADSMGGIRGAIGILWPKALVIVVVTVHDDIGIRFVERLPERLKSWIVAVRAAGTKERLVPVGERAGRRMCGEIGAQSFLLR